MLFENTIYLSFGLVASMAVFAARLFQFWSPSVELITLGGYASLFCMPIIVWLVVSLLGPTDRITHRHKTARNMAMVFSFIVFACAIDLIVSLENDGIISGYMAFYLKDSEPYLTSDYSTAICYWDGIVHFILTIGIISAYMENLNTRFRDLSLFWFGSYVTSVIILMLGSVHGPFENTLGITLNIPYICVPVAHIMWMYSTEPPRQEKDFGNGFISKVVRIFYAVFFITAIIYAVIRLLVALDVMRYGLDTYVYHVERHLHHPHKYPQVTVMMYAFYGIPFYIYAIKNLITNTLSSTFLDLVMVHAGACANAQVGYLGGYFVKKGDEYNTLVYHKVKSYQVFFWTTNVLLFIFPLLLALYTRYCCSEIRSSQRKHANEPVKGHPQESINETRSSTYTASVRRKKKSK